jgi:hypothetical protein
LATSGYLARKHLMRSVSRGILPTDQRVPPLRPVDADLLYKSRAITTITTAPPVQQLKYN